ncbi:MAG: hypothetical protein ACRDWH_05815 [Acidimicrobiia bacterium]
MFWLARPSYGRWAVAILLVVVSVYFEIRPAPTVRHPFSGAPLAAGSELNEALIDWRHVPIGVLPPVNIEGRLLVDVPAGQPLVPALIGTSPAIPAGWWALTVPVPEASIPGTEVRLVVDVRTNPRVIPGLLIRTFQSTGLDGTTALVALPETEAGAVAAALADSALTVLVGADG